MKYAYIQREYSEPFITIGEYIFETDPETFTLLCMLSCTAYPEIRQFIKEGQKLMKAFVSFNTQLQTISTKFIEHLMQERPKPGRGGLLLGEGEEVLYD